MLNIDLTVFSTTRGTHQPSSIKVDKNTKLDEVRTKLQRWGDYLRFTHNGKFLRDPVDWEGISDCRIPVTIIDSPLPFPSSSVRQPVENQVIKKRTGKDKYDMKNLIHIQELFMNYNLNTDDMIEFAEKAQISRDLLDGLEIFKDLLESPFISRLLKNQETLKEIIENYKNLSS